MVLGGDVAVKVAYQIRVMAVQLFKSSKAISPKVGAAALTLVSFN